MLDTSEYNLKVILQSCLHTIVSIFYFSWQYVFLEPISIECKDKILNLIFQVKIYFLSGNKKVSSPRLPHY
jgi:hypothetical protein